MSQRTSAQKSSFSNALGSCVYVAYTDDSTLKVYESEPPAGDTLSELKIACDKFAAFLKGLADGRLVEPAGHNLVRVTASELGVGEFTTTVDKLELFKKGVDAGEFWHFCKSRVAATV